MALTVAPFDEPDSSSDEPPPLEDMSDFVAKLRSANDNLPVSRSTLASSSAKMQKKTDAITLKQIETSMEEEQQQQQKNAAVKLPFRKGFLDPKCHPKKKGKDKDKDNIPYLKADNASSKIPDCLKVDLEDSPRDVLRKELTGLLEPTKDMVKDVMDNDIIKNSLGDPDIMLAVQEIAMNPDAIHKHRQNSKVVSFYSYLGKLIGDKLQSPA